MVCYIVDKKKRKQALKAIIKKNVKKAGFWMRLCYRMTYVFRIIAIVSAGLVSYFVWKNNGYVFEYSWSLFLLVVFFGFSFMTEAIPKGKYSGNHMAVKDEQLVIDNNHLEYSYFSIINGHIRYVYSFEKERVQKVDYDSITKELGIYADINEMVFNRKNIVETNEWSEINLLNVFEGIDLYEALVK